MAKVIEKVWVTGKNYPKDDPLMKYTHLILKKGDELPPRPIKGGSEVWRKKLAKWKNGPEVRLAIMRYLSQLSIGRGWAGTTFHQMCMDVFELEGATCGGTVIDRVLWEMVAQSMIQHTSGEPVLFRWNRG